MTRLLQLLALIAAAASYGFPQDLTAINQNANGGITAANSACTATSCVEIAMPLNSAGMTVQLSGTWSGTVQFESSVTGALWAAITSTGSASSATSNGVYSFNLTGQTYFRVRASAYSSGTVVVAMTGSTGTASSGVGGGPCTVSGSATTGYVLTATSGGSTPNCNWQAGGASGSQITTTFTAQTTVTFTHNLNTSTPVIACFETSPTTYLIGSVNGSGTLLTAGFVQSIIPTSANVSTIVFSAPETGICLASTGGVGATGPQGAQGPAGATGSSTPGGTPGQSQYNNAGALAGYTTSGDATVNTATGALTLSTVNTNTGSCGDATHVCQVTLDGKGRATAAAAVAITGVGSSVLLWSNSTTDSLVCSTIGANTEFPFAQNYTVPANMLANGQGIHVAAGFDSVISTPPNFTIKLRLGSTAGSITGIPLYVGTTNTITASNKSAGMQWDITSPTAAGGAQNVNTSTFGIGAGPWNSNTVAALSASTIATNANQLLQITYTCSGNGAGNSMLLNSLRITQ